MGKYVLRDEKGSISIFLTLVLTVSIALVCTVIESARIYVAKVHAKSVTYMALESEFAGYAKQLFDDYGILMAWECEDIDETVEKYILANTQMADISRKNCIDMTAIRLNDIINKKIIYALDEGADNFVNQAIEYEKYYFVQKEIDKLLKYYDSYTEKIQVEGNQNDITELVENYGYKDNELLNLVKIINEKVSLIKDNKLQGKIKAVRDKIDIINRDIDINNTNLHKKQILQARKKFKKLENYLITFSKNIEEVIKLSDEYEEKKEKLQEQCKEVDLGDDYILQNRAKLKYQNSLIKEYLEREYSEIEDINNTNIKSIYEQIEKCTEIRTKTSELKVIKETKEDEKNKSLYESAVSLLNTGVLELVIEDLSGLSKAAIEQSNLPSGKVSGKGKKPLNNITNKAIYSQYILDQFGNYLESKDESALSYEIEYILGGFDNDKDNLSSVVKQILSIRQFANFIYLLSDSAKVSEWTGIAASIATALALPVLEPIIKIVLLQAWALAESVGDVKVLLGGGKVSIVKDASTWKTTLTKLVPRVDKKLASNDNKGIDYKMYLQLLLMAKDNSSAVYRAMDVIQVNLQKRYNPLFTFERCITYADVMVEYDIKSIFTKLPVVGGFLEGSKEEYHVNIRAHYGY